MDEKTYKLETLTVFSPNGTSFDVAPQLLELSIFEDIYNSTVSGHVILKDGQDLFTKIPLAGFEFILVTFSKPNISINAVFSSIFRIYKVTGPAVKPSNAGFQVYSLHFCSEENVLSISTKVSKSYSGKIISDIILDILQNKLLVRDKLLIENIELTKGRHNIIVPGMNPLTAIMWLTSRALKVTSSGTSASYMFYENREGFNFKSLETLFTNPSKQSYTFGSKNVESGEQNLSDKTQNNIRTVTQYDFASNFDILSGISSGMYSGVLKSVDLTRNRVDNTVFNYINFFNNSKHVENDSNKQFGNNGIAYPFHMNYLDRFNNSIEKNFFASTKMYPTNRNHDTYLPISSKQPGIIPNMVEIWMLQRTSQINQLNYLKLKLLLPGDPTLTIGDIIQFQVPLAQSKDNQSKNINPYHSGRYLVTAIRHLIDNHRYEMIVEATRDCLSASYPEVDDKSIVMTGIRKI